MTTLSGLTIDPLPPRCIRTYFELRCVKDGKPTPLADRAETLNEARELAEWNCRALGEFFELYAGERFTDVTADGVYLLEVKTEFVKSARRSAAATVARRRLPILAAATMCPAGRFQRWLKIAASSTKSRRLLSQIL
jgi:hypothetical protein